jgi:hypothetical protein
MKRMARNPQKFETLDLFTSVGRRRGFRLDNVADVEQFAASVFDSLNASRTNQNLLHGKRIEALFAHVVGALGVCKMIKVEDSGDVFVKGAPVIAPDYRLILDNGRHMLVEVKNFHSESIRACFVIKKKYFEQLERYAALHAVPLKIAVYFSKLNRWALLSPQAFDVSRKGHEISFVNAIAKNEMSELGDVYISTLPELRLELMADEDEANEIGDAGQAIITFRSSKISCDEVELIDELDQRIAFYLMRFGRWSTTSEAIVKNGKLLGIVFQCAPDELNEDARFAAIGELSSMVGEAYKEYTVVDGLPIALDVPVDPEAFALSIPSGYNSERLPLWRFSVRPNWDFVDNVTDNLDRSW